MTLNTGIEMNLIASILPGFFRQPLHHLLSIVFGAQGPIADKVIHIQKSTPCEAVADPIPGEAAYLAIFNHCRQLIWTILLLMQNSFNIFLLREMAPELLHYRIRCPDFLLGRYLFDHFSFSKRNLESSPRMC